ncbi:MAG: chloride channel protein [Kofleriaceae bacterium]
MIRTAKLALAVVVVAIVAALFAIVFRWTLSQVTHGNVVTMIEGLPMWARVLVPAAGGLGAGVIALWSSKLRGTSGVGFVMEAIVLNRARVPLLRSAGQAVASWLSIATGNSLGREGPLIQFGAAAGEGARRWMRLDDSQASMILAAGVAAGFAAAYNAPIAATLFVLEVVTGVVVLEAAVPVMVAAVIATVVVHIFVGGAPIYTTRTFTFVDPVELIAYALLGIACAPLGVFFLRLLSRIEPWWKLVPLPARPAIGGALCGVFLCVMPSVAGNGFEEVTAILDGHLALTAVVWLLVLKPIATASSVGSGNPGGVFTPTLLLGACLGFVFAAGAHALFGDAIASPGTYAMVGLACALAATTHAPLMSALLACELSGDYQLILPLLVSCALAAGVARYLYIDSVYTAELTRRGVRWRLTLDGRRMVENQPGSK